MRKCVTKIGKMCVKVWRDEWDDALGRQKRARGKGVEMGDKKRGVSEKRAPSKGFGKGRTPYSRELYDLLVGAFRERPGEFTVVSQMVGCTRACATHAWKKGWVPRVPWAKPISLLLEEEKEAARALVAQRNLSEAEEAGLLREQARREAIEAHAAEGQMVRLARSDATSLLAAVGKLQPSLHRLSEKLGRMLMDDGEKMTRREAAALLGMLSRTTKEALAAGQVAIELERLHLGAPTQILGVQDVGEMSTEEAVREIEAAAAALKRAKTMGLVSGVNEVNVTPVEENDGMFEDEKEVD